MAGTRPNADNFICYFPLQEASGSRYDEVASYEATDNNTVGQGAGHVGNYAADFVRANNEYLSIADAAWNTFGNESLTMGLWFNPDEISGSDRQSLLCKYNEPNDHEYGMYLESGGRGKSGIARGGHSWETILQSASGQLSTGNWYWFHWWYNADTNVLGHEVYNTSGTELLSATGGNSTGMGTSVDVLSLRIGANEPGGSGGSHYWDGKIEQAFLYAGTFSADHLTWMLNGGAGRKWSSINPVVPNLLPTIIGANF